MVKSDIWAVPFHESCKHCPVPMAPPWHDLTRCLSPLPQDLLQFPQGPQLVHFPPLPVPPIILSGSLAPQRHEETSIFLPFGHPGWYPTCPPLQNLIRFCSHPVFVVSQSVQSDHSENFGSWAHSAQAHFQVPPSDERICISWGQSISSKLYPKTDKTFIYFEISQ